MRRELALRGGTVAVFLALALLAVPSVRATTFVLMDVADLARAADVAVVGRVRSIQSLFLIDGSIATDVAIAIDRVAFGDVERGRVIIVRELGGAVAERRETVFGAPSYQVGEEVFAFLQSGPGETYRTAGMSMGKYRVFGGTDEAMARRDLDARVSVLDPATGARLAASSDDIWRLDALIVESRRAWRRPDRLRPRRGVASAGAGVPAQRGDEYRFLGVPTRWFEPDDGVPVRYFVDSTGDETLGPAVSIAAVHSAFAAWSAVDQSAIELQNAGPTEPAPFSGCPDDNRIVFNDPFGEIQNPSDCRGVLALGGFCETGETRTVSGIVFKRIVTGKLTFNNGWGACPIWTACGLAEIATHEIGHTIGLGHSEVGDATMATNAHFDGRCASLRDDDETGVRVMYPPAPPSVTPTYTASATATASATPTISSTPTATGTPTLTPRPPTATRTPTASRTPTRTNTPSRTATATNTRPPTRTVTGPRPSTATATATATATSTPTATPGPDGEPFIALLLRALRRMLKALLTLFPY